MTVDRKMLARKAGDDEVLLAFAEMYAQFTDEVLIPEAEATMLCEWDQDVMTDDIVAHAIASLARMNIGWTGANN